MPADLDFAVAQSEREGWTTSRTWFEALLAHDPEGCFIAEAGGDWSLVENQRVDGGRKVVQRHALYLGEINSYQQSAWRKTIDVFETGATQTRTVALFPEERSPAVDDDNIVRIRLDQLELRRPRQWGACWLASVLYQKLRLDEFWSERLPASRKGTRWDQVLQTLVSYRLIDPGSEWRLHREWFDKSAMADLLGADYRLAADDTLYRCLDQLVEHKAESCLDRIFWLRF